MDGPSMSRSVSHAHSYTKHDHSNTNLIIDPSTSARPQPKRTLKHGLLKTSKDLLEDDHNTPQPRRKGARLQKPSTLKILHPHESQSQLAHDRVRRSNRANSTKSKVTQPQELTTIEEQKIESIKLRHSHQSSTRTRNHRQAKHQDTPVSNSIVVTSPGSKRKTKPPITTCDDIGVTTQEQKTAKRQLEYSDKDGYEAGSSAKRLKQDSAPYHFNTVVDNDSFVVDWLAGRNWSGQSSVADPLLEISEVMPVEPSKALPSPRSSCAGTDVASRTSEGSSANVRDTNYRQTMRLRNIYVEREDAPALFMQQAARIISRSRASPEMDDTAIRAFIDKSRRLQEEAEDELVQQLAPDIIEAMNGISDSRLARNANQKWYNAVPVPLDASVLINPIPLPRPAPDLTIGYSETAFTRNQLSTIDLLVDDQCRSYAIPDKKVRFPFLSVEFKSQAKNGTHYVATNQAAGAGAIALHGAFELVERGLGRDAYNYNEPQFFSVTMDHEIARINVHWLKAPSEEGQYSFHVEGLSKHFLDDPAGIRKVVRAIKNILDYGSDRRLRDLCGALDAYREKVICDREVEKLESQRHGSGSIGQEALVESLAPFETQPEGDGQPCGIMSPSLLMNQQLAPKAVKRRRRTLREAAPEGSEIIVDPFPHKHNQQSAEQRTSSSTQVRQTRSTSKAPPIEVRVVRRKNKSQYGWTFELQGRQCFTPDNKWCNSMKDGRAVLINPEFNVWCYAKA